MKYNCLNIGSRDPSIELPSLLEKNFNIYSLDIDPKAKADITADLLSLPQREELPPGEGGLRTAGKFDAVYCSHVLEHFPPEDTLQALRAMAFVLKPSGFLILRIPSIEMLVYHCQQHNIGFAEDLSPHTGIPKGVTGYNVIFGMPYTNEWMQHKRHFTAQELVKEVKIAGFSEVQGGFFPHALEIMLLCYGPDLDPGLRDLITHDVSLIYMDDATPAGTGLLDPRLAT